METKLNLLSYCVRSEEITGKKIRKEMSPRPYQLGRRQAATDQTRASIIAAARELLMSGDGFSGFTIDAVAKQAGVARMTVYYQFGSKVGLLEAISDDLAAHGQMERLANAFRQANVLDALAEFIVQFFRFWASDRLVLRRLRSFAARDTDFAQVLQARDERRREGLRVITRRLMAEYGRPAQEQYDETVDILYTLTSFESFDMLATATRTAEEAAALVHRFVCAALGVAGSIDSTTPDTI